MLRGGGVCVEGPAASADSLPRVSPRIRALQDRLLDSLPADGAWECLSPAQREAIISLHRARLTRNFVTGGDAPDRGKRQNRKNNANNSKAITKGLNRYGRSRSYEDKLESETDDSGVRVASGEGERGTNSSSTSNSQNSHEDDSSDPGVKRAGGGRFAKSASADRLARSKDVEGKTPSSSQVIESSQHHKRKGVVTNGVGNVNKIISKQLHNRSGPHQSASNVTLDCRNFQGDRRRTRIDKDVSVFETRHQQQHNAKLRRYHAGGDTRLGAGNKPQEGIISRKNILQRYQDSPPSPSSSVVLKEGKEGTSSEEYDSSMNFRFEVGTVDGEGLFDQALKSPSPRQPTGGGKTEYGFDFESGRTPRSDSTTPSPSSPNRKEGARGGRGPSHEGQLPRSRSRTSVGADDPMDSGNGYPDKGSGKGRNNEALHWGGDSRTDGVLLPSAVLKRNKKMATGVYEAKLKSDFDYRNHLNQEGIINKYSSNWNSIILSKELPIKTHNIPPAKAHSRNMNNNPLYRTSAAPHGRSAGNLVATAAASRAGNGGGRQNNEARTKPTDDPRLLCGPHSLGEDPGGGGGGKKFARSKSLDRKYVEEEDSSDDESDFEVRRRTERMRRYAKAAGLEWEARKQQLPFDGIPPAGTAGELLMANPFPDYPLHEGTSDAAGVGRPKARSAWDISVGGRTFSDNLAEEEDENNHNNGESCFRSRSTILNRWKSEESELASHPLPRGGLAVTGGNKLERRRKEAFSKELSRSRWRRRSCDFELDVSDNDGGPGGVARLGGDGSPPVATPSFPPLVGDVSSKQWQRRSCDFELELRNNFEDDFMERKNLYDEDCWEQSIEGEMRLIQHRQRLQSSPPRGGKPRRRRGYPTQDSPGGDGVKKKKVAERCYVQDEGTVEGRTCREEEEIVSMPLAVAALEEHPMQYHIPPEISGRKWARMEDMQNCPGFTRGYPSGHKPPTKGKNGKVPLGFRGKLRFFKSILSF